MSNLFEEDVKAVFHKLLNVVGGNEMHPLHAEIENIGGTEDTETEAKPDAPE